MRDKLKTFPQYCVPQKALSSAFGWLAALKKPLWFKNWGINHFIKKYRVDMSEALDSQPESYRCFNAFFTRQLKPHLRPLGKDIISPADGQVSEIGPIQNNHIFQAKNHYFSLANLLGGDESLASVFQNGSYATFYLSPRDYHRVHMPISGQLKKMIYIPGKLFSVNQRTARTIPELFAKNERVVTLFDTPKGKVAVILVGAMIVGSIATQWAGVVTPPRKGTIQTWNYDDIFLEKGEEMGYFQLGSTVIVLFQANQIQWDEKLKNGETIKMGQVIGI